MKTYRKTAMLVGSAYLFSNVTFILGTIMMVQSILGSPDYINLISASRAQVMLGVLLSFANGLAYVGIAVFLFPILKPRFESLALAYVGFRVVEFITQILADVSPLALLLSLEIQARRTLCRGWERYCSPSASGRFKCSISSSA